MSATLDLVPQATTVDLLTSPSPFTRAIGRALAAAMKERGVTQVALAEMSGVPRPVISQIVNGKRNTTLARVEHLFRVLGRGLDVTTFDTDAKYQGLAERLGEQLAPRSTP